MKKLISIIIPIYNVQDYLEKCINSVINQTFKDIEIILINDGSSDNSYAICQEFTQRDKRIVLFTQENKGLGFARNLGILQAKTDYIFFLDSDDYIEPDTIENLYNKSLLENSDIVIGGWEKFNPMTNMPTQINPFIDIDKLNSKDKASYIFSYQFTPISCGILFKKKLFIENYLFFPNYIFEDLHIMTKIYYFAKNITYIENKFYKWQIRPNSLSNSFSINHAISLGGIIVDWSNFLIKEGIYEEIKYSLFDGFIKFLSYLKNKTNAFAKDNEKEKILAYLDNLENNFDVNFSQYIHNNKNSIKNLNFTYSLNRLYERISHLKNDKNTYAIYGNGIVGNLLAKELNDKLVVIIDKNLLSKSEFVETCTPENIPNYNFDKIIISVLGRESEISKYLKESFEIKDENIITFNLE